MSSLLMRIIAIVIVLIGAIFGVAFYLDNLTLTTVNVLGKPIAELQLALWLILFFAAGCLFGWLIASAQALKYRYQLRKLRKQAEDTSTLPATRAPLLNS